MEITFSKKCLEYNLGTGNYMTVDHPERAERVASAYEFLKNKGFNFLEPEKASERDLLLVHSREHIENIKNESGFYDVDTPFFDGMYDYAALAAGSAIKAGEIALNGKKSFSLMRPPGHHASQAKAAGFCYFNNIAVASAKLLKEKKTGKIAILDIDLHHGNGTEAIFSNNGNVLYTSLHLYPAYPGTGAGHLKNSFNFPLPKGTEETQYLKSLEDALSRIHDFKPEIVAVSAGFDTYKKDPVENDAVLIDFGCYPTEHRGIALDIGSYRKIGEKINGLNIRTFSVLEGGYSDKVGECIYEFISGLDTK